MLILESKNTRVIRVISESSLNIVPKNNKKLAGCELDYAELRAEYKAKMAAENKRNWKKS